MDLFNFQVIFLSIYGFLTVKLVGKTSSLYFYLQAKIWPFRPSSRYSVIPPINFFSWWMKACLIWMATFEKKEGFILLSWWMKPCFGICGANIYRWWNGCSLWEAIFFVTSVFEMWIINCLQGSFHGWRKNDKNYHGQLQM